jgi:hypothetical protein
MVVEVHGSSRDESRDTKEGSRWMSRYLGVHEINLVVQRSSRDKSRGTK